VPNPSKGRRLRVNLRVPVIDYGTWAAAAARHSMTLTDFVIHAVRTYLREHPR
jgi:uncharacterized protein (DUF1778 family)